MNEHEAIWQDIEAVTRLSMDIDERWRDIMGYEGYYQVSNLGRVRSVCRKWRPISRILTARAVNRYGHLAVDLHKDATRWTVTIHRLVASTWIGPCPNGKQVRHGSNGKLDNSVSNLCYGTRSEDCLDKRRDGTHGGRPVKRSDGKEFISATVAAEEMGCTFSNIYNACCSKQKTAVGYTWEFIGPQRKKGTGIPRAVRRSDGIEFESMEQAARETHCLAPSIGRVCQGKRKTHHGYGWEYVNEEIEERDTDAELPGGNNSNREVFTTHQESIQ